LETEDMKEFEENESYEINMEPVEFGSTTSENGTVRHFAKFDSMPESVPHKIGGPAIIYENGTEEWWVNGFLHREDGPAIRYASEGDYFEGGEEWYLNGLMHRTDGPALKNRFKEEWWQNGVLHRVDGPAIIRTEKLAKGNYYLANRFWLDPNRTATAATIVLTEPPPILTQGVYAPGLGYVNHITVRTDGIAEKEWWIHGKKHRWDGPAVEFFDVDIYYNHGIKEEFWIDGFKIDRLKEVLENCAIEGDPSTWTDGEFMILRLALTEDLVKARKTSKR
jgi:hypothetical protein